jgi:hypothetical protein
MVLGKNGLEAGGNSGSNLYLSRFSDTGGFLNHTFSVARNTGEFTFYQPVTGVPPTASNHLVTKGYVDGHYIDLASNQTNIGGIKSFVNKIGSTRFESTETPSAGEVAGLTLMNGASLRWVFGKNGLESGGNSGSNLYLSRFADNGSFINHTFSVSRVTGELTFYQPVTATQFRLSTLNTAPASATSTGTVGEVRITATGIYICIATNTWIKAAVATF